MPTTRQKKLAKVIIQNSVLDKPLNAGQMLEKVGYSENVAKGKPREIFESEGVQEALKAQGFTEENAMDVVQSIMLNDKIDPNARLKATDQVFKVKGSYAPEKSINVNVNASSEARRKSKEAITLFLNEKSEMEL